MKRQLAFEVAGQVADLGIDCTVSIAAPLPAEDVPENCIVHVTGLLGSGIDTLVQLIDLAANHGLDLQLGNRDPRITDLPAPRLRSVS